MKTTEIKEQVLAGKYDASSSVFGKSFQYGILYAQRAVNDEVERPLIITAKAVAKGAYNAIISGAGSTLMAYAPVTSNTDEIGRAMVEALASKGMEAVYHVLNIDVDGAKIL